MKCTMLILLLLLCPALMWAQKIDNTASFRDIKAESYFRYHYDNDYFTSTDKNYTQGYNFEVVLKVLKANPLNYFFIKPAGNEIRYGLSLEHIGYAPDNIKSPDIQYGDRPFAAAIFLKSFTIATDTFNKSRLASSLSLGIIGPGAFGKEMQVAIHESTGNTIPQGWQNQVRNDAVVNYMIRYEKQLLQFRDFFSLQAASTLQAGTLFTHASIGLNATIGIINTPFAPLKNGRKFELYLYSEPVVTAVAYDATLQGGVFNHKSPYTIADSDIERFTAQHNYGIILQTKRLYFEYSRTAITREFRSVPATKWGGIRFGFQF